MKDFEHFIGKVVIVDEKPYRQEFPRLGIVSEGVEVSVSPNDTVVKLIALEAHQHNMDIRVHLPGSIHTLEYRRDRLNVMVEKKDDAYVINHIDVG